MRKILACVGCAILVAFCMIYGMYFIQIHGINHYLAHELVLHMDRIIPFILGIFVLLGIGIKKLFLLVFKKRDK